MIKADVLITNKNWKKYIRTPSAYINKQLKKVDKNTNLFKSKITINIENKIETVKIQDIQRHPFKEQILHADFIRI